MVAIILLSGLAAPYVADPAAVKGWPKYVVAISLAGVAGFSAATLGFLGYCLAFARTKSTDDFLQKVLFRAGVGAIFGTLLGLRIAPPIVGAAIHSPVRQSSSPTSSA
jgi:hypothetical protein